MFKRLLLTALAALVCVVLPAQAYTHKTLFNFCIKKCHRGPIGVTRDAAGNLYAATTIDAHAQPDGAVFKLTLNGKRYDFELLHTFTPQESVPDSTPIVDVNGNVYGTTSDLVYELIADKKRGTWTFKNLSELCEGCENIADAGQLTYAGYASGAPYDGTSPLYTTHTAGSFGGGRVIQLVPGQDQWTTNVLYDFCQQSQCPDGLRPVGGVVLTPSGTLSGVTVLGGTSTNCTSGCGTVFQLVPTKNGATPWTLTTLHNFCPVAGCADGANPSYALTMDAAGNLIGTTYADGTSNKGTLYTLTPHGTNSKQTVLHNFCADCAEGFTPSSGVTIDGSGAIFGETLDSTPGKGTVYRYADSTYSVAYTFCVNGTTCLDGWQPQGGMLLDAAGDLTGVTLYGGRKNGIAGTVFELIP